MRLFWRRSTGGKHALGAAVTAIPSAPRRVPLPPVLTGPSGATPASPVPAPAAPTPDGPDQLAEGVVDLVAPAPLLAPDLLSEFAALLVSGEAWADGATTARTVRPPVSAGVPPRAHSAELPSAPPVEPGAPGDGDRPPAPWTYAVLGMTPASPEPASTEQPAAPTAPAAPAIAVQVSGPAPDPDPNPDPGPLAPLARHVPAPASVPVLRPAVSEPASPVPVPGPSTVPPLEAALAELLPQQADGGPTVPPLARVQLGFRDGTSTALDPTSDQSQALQELARSLVRRD